MNASPSSRRRRSDDISGRQTPAHACEDGDANCRLQKRAAICFATVLYNENTNSDVWRRRRPALSDTAQWVCGEQIVGQMASPPNPIVNAQARGVVPNASWMRTSYQSRRSSQTAARWFLIRLLKRRLKNARCWPPRAQIGHARLAQISKGYFCMAALQ